MIDRRMAIRRLAAESIRRESELQNDPWALADSVMIGWGADACTTEHPCPDEDEIFAATQDPETCLLDPKLLEPDQKN